MRACAASALLICGLPGCIGSAPVTPAPSAGPDYYQPLTVRDLKTTSEAVFLGNLDARIEATERVAENRPAPRLLALLAEDYLLRSRILGRLEDTERALELSARAWQSAPGDAGVVVTRARLLASIHQFEQARELLKALPPSPATERQRQGLDFAQGRYERLPPVDSIMPADFDRLVDRALRLIDVGDTDGAHRAFDAAQRGYREVNPFPLTWLQTQQGILYLRQGRLDDAARYFRAANERMPRYYVATEHLAEVALTQGDLDTAARLYRAVVAQTDDPEFLAQLAVAEARLGNDAASAQALVRAREGFEHRLARHEATFADHAVEFYLEQHQPERALQLARRNAEVRQTVGALLLLAETQHAVGQQQAACLSWQKVLDTGLRPPEWHELAASGIGACDPS